MSRPGRTPFDPAVLLLAAGLCGVGLLCIFSATHGSPSPAFKGIFLKQGVWVFLGICAAGTAAMIPPSMLSRSAFAIYGVTLVLLVAVAFAGTGRAGRWLDLGPFRLQPSEAAKLAQVLVISRIMTGLADRKGEIRAVVLALALTMIPVWLIARQPDLGTATVLVAVAAGVVVWSGLSFRTIVFLAAPVVAVVSGWHPAVLALYSVLLIGVLAVMKCRWWVVAGFGGLCILVGFLSSFGWSHLEIYQQERIRIFLGITSDPLGAAYQGIQSKVAIGSGGFFGKGFLHGSQTQLRFLPEQHTDFVFTVLGEEFGFLGAAAVLGLYLALLLRMLRAAKSRPDSFSRNMAAGIAAMMVYQVGVNVGMTLGLVPVAGIPLPLMSYGGSSLLVTMFGVGLTARRSDG